MQVSKLILKPIITLDEFLDLYDGSFSSDYKNILNLDFELNLNRENQRICPTIHLAKPADAEVITQIFKDVYEGTYPYKQMENVQEIKNMIINSNYYWFLFKINTDEVVGCFAAHMEFEKKRGLLFSFAIKKKYQKVIDILKAFIGCVLYAWKVNKDKILVWYAEVRTNDSIPQAITSLCGLKPIAFFPNKDIFMNEVESIFMHVIYDEKALQKLRSKKNPEIIRQILPSYSYSNNRYHLGSPKVNNLKFILNSNKISKLRNKTISRMEEIEDYNKVITFSIRNSNSYFKFLYNPIIRTIEKTKYEVNNLEELFVYIEELKNLIKKLKVRYFQCFVSSYEPKHQDLFFITGFKPMGYVFSWEYKAEQKKFEDRIVFSYYEDKTNKNIQLIPESLDLIKFLKIS